MGSHATMRPTLEGSHEVKLPEGNYGVPDTMLHGFQSARNQNMAGHPLEYSEKHWNENKMKMDMGMLRNTQGLHAPLKLHMEHRITGMMHRLPGLPSSNILQDSLSGRDEIIDFDDILNVPEESEAICQPHIQMEKSMGIL